MSSRSWPPTLFQLEPPAPRAQAAAPHAGWPQAGRIILLLSLSMWAAIWKLGTLLF